MPDFVIALRDEIELGVFRCGRCGDKIPDASNQDHPPANYCVNCGARLDQSKKKRPPRIEWEG